MEEKYIIEKDFKELVLFAKQDILKTRLKVQENANMELIKLYFRLGKIISENAKYGNRFIEDFSVALKLEFPNTTGFSARNLSRMKKFYDEYKDLSNLPTTLAKLPWSHNNLLLDKVKNINEQKSFVYGGKNLVIHCIGVQINKPFYSNNESEKNDNTLIYGLKDFSFRLTRFTENKNECVNMDGIVEMIDFFSEIDHIDEIKAQKCFEKFKNSVAEEINKNLL